MAGFSAGGDSFAVSDVAAAACAVSGERELLVFQHTSGDEVFWGDAAVSSSNFAFSTRAGDRLVMDRDRPGEVMVKASWFGVCASGGSAVVNVGEVLL